MRKGWASAGLTALALAACEQQPPPDVTAPAREACARAGAAPAERLEACEALLVSGVLAQDERAEVLVVRGEIRRAQNDPTGALEDFNAALLIDRNLGSAQLGKASVLLRSGQLDAAAALVDSALASGVQPGRAHLLRGELYVRQGDAAAALAEFDAAVALDSFNAAAFAQRGLAKQSFEDYAQAGRDFDAALRLDAREPYARAGRCWNSIYLDRALDAAAADAEAAIAAEPSLTLAQLCLGLVRLRQEQWAAAQAVYTNVLEREPANASALFGRGFARRELGEGGAGAADIRQAYEYDSSIDEVFESLGVDF